MKLHYFHTARGAIAIRSYDEAKPRSAKGLIRAILLGSLVTMALLWAQQAHAQESYNPQLAAERREAIRSVIVTRKCMFDSSQALIRQGVRKREALEAFAVAACGARMRTFLVGVVKWPQEDAETLIKAFAAREVDSSLSWGL